MTGKERGEKVYGEDRVNYLEELQGGEKSKGVRENEPVIAGKKTGAKIVKHPHS